MVTPEEAPLAVFGPAASAAVSELLAERNRGRDGGSRPSGECERDRPDPDGTRLVTGGRDGGVWLWDLAGRSRRALPGHKSYVWSLAFTPDGATLASGSADGTVRLWDTAPLKTRYETRHRQAAALRPEAERLVDRWWRQTNDPAEVVAALRADRA